jgi:cytoskeletal protein CcmA (bactofilin family)
MKLRTILNALLLFAVALVWAAPLDTSQLAPSVYYGPDGTIAVTEGKLYTVDSSGNPTALTASATEMNYIDGVTPGTLAASKAVIVNSSKKINEWDPTSLKINGTAITASAAELNALDITAAGTAQASKAVVLGADSKINTIDMTSLTLTGELVTATATEINKLAGVTAGTVTASKAVVVGASSKVDVWDPTSLKINGTAITPTAAQINLLLQGTAAGKKVASGTADITSSATIAAGTHGLATVTGVWASLSDPPSMTGNDVATTVSGTNIIIYVYKPTADSDCTPIEATDPRAVQWFAIGT